MTFAKIILATAILTGSVSAAFAGTTVFEGGATDLQPTASSSVGSAASRQQVLMDLRAFQQGTASKMAWEGGEASRLASPSPTAAVHTAMQHTSSPRTLGSVRFGTFEGGEAGMFPQQSAAMQDKAARVQ